MRKKDALKIYLDDCLAAKILVSLLKKRGLSVVVPQAAGLEGRADWEHFEFCCRKGYVLLTANPSDFLALHQKEARHPGILAVYQDNNPKKDLNFKEMASVIQKIVKKKIPLAGQFVILNHWRRAPKR